MLNYKKGTTSMYIKIMKSNGEIIGHIVIWMIIIAVTLGVGLLFYPYAFISFFLNNAYIVSETNQEKLFKMKSEIDMSSQIGHILIWLLLVVLSCTLLLPVYYYKVFQMSIEKINITSIK